MSIYCNYSVSTNSPESLPGNAVVHLPNINGKQLLFCSICNITFILSKVKVWNIISYFFHIRACLKNHSRNLHAPLCGIFCPNSVAVARYGAFIRTKSPTNCDAHLAESLFQTRSRLFQTGFRVFSSHISSS